MAELLNIDCMEIPRLSINKTYYWHKPTWEFNLPAGVTCPYARACKVFAGENTGRFLDDHTEFKCYAASAERFPAARKSRWKNYRGVLRGIMPDVSESTHVRIHMSGDFFSQWYFDIWLAVAYSHAGTMFWAFTKSLPFWVSRIDVIPPNLNLTASLGGHYDWMVSRHKLKSATVYKSRDDVPIGVSVDVDDYYAANGNDSFALLDNSCKRGDDKSVGLFGA
jgi:hypothetical protein